MKATHNGTCQVCGAIQAVNAKTNRLAKHGYTTRWGFFAGTCSGSDEKPFELSAGLIFAAIEKALKEANELRDASFHLRNNDTGNKAWIHEYVPAYFIGGGKSVKSTYKWVQVELQEEVKPYRDGSGSYSVFWYHKVDGKGTTTRKDLDGYGHSKSFAEAVKYLNSFRAQWQDTRESQLRVYAQWQTDRVRDWKEQPLLERRAA